MNIAPSTSEDLLPYELLDVQVQTRPQAGQSLLWVQFLCSRDNQPDQKKMPPLTWFDANQLQQFVQQLTVESHPENVQVDLPDAGLRLTSTGVVDTTIRIEPLPKARGKFVPFAIKTSGMGIRRYARLLYQRLWEAFCG
ncbi:hypothetical protein GCM10023189_50240 [Nibrella saemangeumensis]|uniref:DUF2867 domain-containing protein n=1 Tax=Nibrella saemangeumensis TaxID=1084526 RepID=A0ABP8NL16_9BACT